MRRKPKLTTRGKHALLMCLTFFGCVAGLVVALLIGAICENTGTQTQVLAKESAQRKTQTASEEMQIMPQWLYYQSCSSQEEVKKEMDVLVNRWTKKNLTDDELSEQMMMYLKKKEIQPSVIGVQSEALCLFSSANALPDYAKMLSEYTGVYDFIGVYTDGEYDENGRLICYYWEAGIKE